MYANAIKECMLTFKDCLLWIWKSFWFPIQIMVSISIILYLGAHFRDTLVVDHQSWIHWDETMSFVIGIYMTIQTQIFVLSLLPTLREAYFRLWRNDEDF